MRLTLLAPWLFGASLVVAQAYDYGVDVDIQNLTRRSNEDEPIVVEQLPLRDDGSVPFRLEIRDLRKNRYKWDLYILALNMFQHVSQDNPTSWYQIAGLHGAPFISWNGVEAAPGAGQSGYCSHSSVLFPTWHRPYLALYEQQIYRMVNVIAGLFPNMTERQSYQDAASDFRIPYWDWSLAAPKGETFFPDVLWNASMVQYGPRGQQRIKNPLYSYRFHPKTEDALIWRPLNQWDETKRAPNLTKSMTDPPSNNALVNDALTFKLPEIQQRLLALFSTYNDYNSFSCKIGFDSQNMSTWDSLEAIHDIIHTNGGLDGHMTYVPLSAFDPLFFLHHAMTDRLFAMWQTANPTSWMKPERAGQASFTTPKGTMQQSNSSLTPFLASANGTFWDSDMSRDTEAFGYTYAETAPSVKRGDRQTDVTEFIKTLYRHASPEGLPEVECLECQRYSQKLESERLRKGGSRFNGKQPNVTSEAIVPPRSWVVRNGQFTEWYATAEAKMGALAGKIETPGPIFGSLSIYFFLGEVPKVPKEPTEWMSSSNFMGLIRMMDMHLNLDPEQKIAGNNLPMTMNLVKMVAVGEIPHLGVNSVEPFLRETLQFRVVRSGTVLDPREVTGLSITILSVDFHIKETELESNELNELTERIALWKDGKPGV